MALELKEILWGTLAAGVDQIAPPRSLGPGSPKIYRDALNLIEREGTIARRAIFDPTISLSLTTGTVGEVPVHLEVLDCRNAGVEDFLVICVTSRQIFINLGGGGWVNVTPTYNAGTVTLTNGSGNFTGAGTLWLTNNITVGTVFLDDTGASHTVTAITTDTAGTFTPVYAGATAGGKSYLMRRVFPGTNVLDAVATEIFVEVYNNNLYVAGTWCGTSTTASRCPAVIKIGDIFSGSPTKTYLTASRQLQAGLDTISTLDRICGLKALQDGRIIVAGAQNSIFYSSNLNDAVWTVSPAGQTPIDLIDGRINALGRVGNVFTLHHNSGIVNGYPTGQSDPPLRYQASGATVGAHGPRTLKTLKGAEIYVSHVGNVERFDLSANQAFGDALRPTFQNLDKASLYHMWASIDHDRGEYILWRMSYPDTFFWIYQSSLDSWWPCRVAIPIGTASDGFPLTGQTPRTRAFAGASTLDDTTPRTDTLLFMNEPGIGGGGIEDGISYASSSNGGFYVVLDDQDGGDPSQFSTALATLLWVINSNGSGTDTLKVSVSPDNGATYPATATATISGASLKEVVKRLCFDENSGHAGPSQRFKIEVDSTNAVRVRLVRFKAALLVGGWQEFVEF